MDSQKNDNLPFDIEKSRSIRNYSSRELTARVLWCLALPLFRYSPRLFYSFRNTLLRIFGARVGSGVHIHQTAKIRYPWLFEIGNDTAIGENAIIYNLGMVSIGDRSTVSQNAHLCAGTHDHNDISFRLMRSTISIGNDCWICADAFIGPDVSIFDRCIVAARAVVVTDVPAGQIVGGNPGKQIGTRKQLS